jgi:hypothetical protein
MVFNYFKLTIFLILLHTACSKGGINKIKGDNKSSFEITSKSLNTIDSNGIGDFNVCDRIERDKLNKQYSISIDTISYEENSWLGYYVFEDSLKKRWVLIESLEIDSDKIGKLSTNSPSFLTKEGFKVGDKVSDILKRKENFEIRIEEGDVYLYLFSSTSLLFFNNLLKVPFETFEAAYFTPGKNEKGDLIKMLNKDAVISEILIISYCNS